MLHQRFGSLSLSLSSSTNNFQLAVIKTNLYSYILNPLKSIFSLKCDETPRLEIFKHRNPAEYRSGDERSRGKRQFFCGFIIRLAGGGNLLKPALSKTGSRSLTLCPAPMAANSSHLKRWRASLKNEQLSIPVLLTFRTAIVQLLCLVVACKSDHRGNVWLYFGQ